jgi:hypothetical protein
MIERSGRALLLRGTAGSASVVVYGGDAIADPRAVTVTITGADGTVLVTGGATTPLSGATARSYALTPAQTARLDVLTCTWSVTIGGVPQTVETEVEIVGDLLFTVAEARTFDKAQLANPTKFSTETIAALRDELTETFAAICGVSFVPRYRQEVLGTEPSGLLVLSTGQVTAIRDLAWLGSDGAWAVSGELPILLLGSVVSETLVGLPAYVARAQAGRFARLGYEHGYRRVPPAIRRAALTVAKTLLPGSPLDERATAQDIGGTLFRLAAAGERGRYFGIPSVDATLAQYAASSVLIG